MIFLSVTFFCYLAFDVKAVFTVCCHKCEEMQSHRSNVQFLANFNAYILFSKNMQVIHAIKQKIEAFVKKFLNWKET